ncbi:spindle and kinetochore-associated protein 3 isoform X1 [Pteropus alecto]|uniref:spindle and kinetochore-associated protein 3 isoform X1 n=2 Tax=Pteropus alecto TaxID=9402 RepID=UPI0003F149B1|nr:spindle and kinetochore-associated protein 3 isoform X1 [Pteropus alecto]
MTLAAPRGSNEWLAPPARRGVLAMELIRSFCGRLRALAVTLDSETARLQRALEGEDSDFEVYPMRILHDLHSEVRTLKDDVSTLLDKASLESKESICFIKAAKVLMKKNSVDIMKVREVFQKYGYNPRAKNGSGGEQEADTAPESAGDATRPGPDGEDDAPPPAAPRSRGSGTSVSSTPPSSPQLADFGLERYLVAAQAGRSHTEGREGLTPPSQPSPAKVRKTTCALSADDFECLTPKLQHLSISQHSASLNGDLTVGLGSMEDESEEAIETEPVSGGDSCATPGLVNQRLGRNGVRCHAAACLPDVACAPSPSAPAFCTPGLRLPRVEGSAASASTNYPPSKTNSSSSDWEVKGCTSSALSSDKCFDNFMAPSSPTISSYENLLRTPTPPKVTAVPEDILQILSKYNRNLVTPVTVQAVPPRAAFLARGEGPGLGEVGDSSGSVRPLRN